jgi:3'-phosphoadenosine 5'-phosphosulfate (PAPS) 3'-phosphatase
MAAINSELVSNANDLMDRAATIAIDGQRELSSLEIETKIDNTPVSKIDRALSLLFEKELPKILPGSVVVSEEALLPAAQKSPEQQWFWFVDPIDATKEYICGGREWAVQVALFRGAEAVGSWVWVPQMNLRLSAFGSDQVGRAGTDSNQKLTGLLSRSRKDLWAENVYSKLGVDRFELRSSIGYKAYSIARGEADFYANSGGFCGVWDLAPCVLPLLHAGGQLLMAHSRPFDVTSYLSGQGKVDEPFALVGPRLMHRRQDILDLINS